MSSGASLFDMVAVVAVAVIVGVALLVTLMRRSGSHPYGALGTLLSAAEVDLLDALREALGDRYEVFPKVQLADVITVRKGLTPKQHAEALARLGGRHADFVVCDRASREIRGVVRFDAEPTARKGRHPADPFLEAALAVAQVPLVRLPAQASLTTGELRGRVLSGLRPIESPAPKSVGALSRFLGPGLPPKAAPQGAGILDRVRGIFRGGTAEEGVGSAVSWLPTRGVLVMAAVLLILGAVLSWFVEPTPKTAKARPAKPPAVAAKPPPPASPPAARTAAVPPEPPTVATKAPEIIGYRDVRIPGRPLAECMGPDNEIGPEVLRCRDGYVKREPIYR